MSKSMQTDPREEVLRQAFIDGTNWPPDPASLCALISMGMPYGRIASYFAVKRTDVCDLRARYGIAPARYGRHGNHAEAFQRPGTPPGAH